MLLARNGGRPVHRVQHAAEAEQVGCGDRRRSPLACSGDMYSGVPATTPVCVRLASSDGAGQAEVGDLDALDAVLQQDVGRLDVAVDQPLRVGRGQALGDLHADAQDLRRAPSGPLRSSCSCSDAAVDVLHDQVGQAVGLLDGVDGDDVVVADGGGGPGLAHEALAGGAAGRPAAGPAP